MSDVKTLTANPVRVLVVLNDQVVMNQVFQHSPISLGRMMDNDIVLPFEFASRYHCEIRNQNGFWSVHDLKSKNGVATSSGQRRTAIALGDGGEFMIDQMKVRLLVEASVEISQDFTPLPGAGQTEPGTRVALPMDREQPAIRGTSTVWTPSAHELLAQGPSPVLNFDLKQGLLSESPAGKSIQASVLWHDQLLEVREFAVGELVTLEIGHERVDFGVVQSGRTCLRLHKGMRVVGESSSSHMLYIQTGEIKAIDVGHNCRVHFRFVPQSRSIPLTPAFGIDPKMVDPLLISGAAHGVFALAVVLAPNTRTDSKQFNPADPPERFAKIVLPEPVPVATPAPTPEPVAIATPTPAPTPIEVAKVEPTPRPEPVKPPPKLVRKIVVDKKRRAPALARRETQAAPAPRPSQPTRIDPPPSRAPASTVAVAEPVVEAPPAPTPQPFQARSVGALKALAILRPTGVQAALANVDQIRVARAGETRSGSSDLVGARQVQGTGQMISNLSTVAASAQAPAGRGAGIALSPGRERYNTGGLASGTGRRRVLGTVVGGATYTDLTKNEGLTKEQVMKVVSQHTGLIQQCYERSLIENPDLVGRAEFEWEISAKGQVSNVRVKETTLRGADQLLSCVRGVFAKMSFPQAKNGEATTPSIGLPFGRL
jgi:hypothetical protein